MYLKMNYSLKIIKYLKGITVSIYNTVIPNQKRSVMLESPVEKVAKITGQEGYRALQRAQVSVLAFGSKAESIIVNSRFVFWGCQFLFSLFR